MIIMIDRHILFMEINEYRDSKFGNKGGEKKCVALTVTKNIPQMQYFVR